MAGAGYTAQVFGYSSRGSGFYFQHPHDGSQPPEPQFQWPPIPPSGSMGTAHMQCTYTYAVYIHTCSVHTHMQAKPTHK